MKVKIKELRKVADKIFLHLEKTGRSSIDVRHEFYWHIPSEIIYDNYEEPNSFTIGQLSNDWQHLEAILQNEEITNGYALVWLASIMRAIGEDNIG